TRFVLPSRVRPGPRRDAANLPSESRPERGRCEKGRPRGRECFRHENYDSITSHVRRDWAGSTATAGTVGLLEQRAVSRTGERIRSPVLREFSLPPCGHHEKIVSGLVEACFPRTNRV